MMSNYLLWEHGEDTSRAVLVLLLRPVLDWRAVQMGQLEPCIDPHHSYSDFVMSSAPSEYIADDHSRRRHEAPGSELAQRMPSLSLSE